jgi:hypothetical protein
MSKDKIKENPQTPNVNLMEMQEEIDQVAKDVLASKQQGLFQKLGFGGKTKEVSPVNGTDILAMAFFRQDRTINKLVSQLGTDPLSQAVRMQIVQRALEMEARPTIEIARVLLVHACLPLHWGEVTGPSIGLVLRTLKIYLERVLQVHKEQMMSIQSSVLKNVNLSGIDVNEEDMEDSNVRNREAMMMEVRMCEAMIERIGEAQMNLQKRMNVSLSKNDLDQALDNIPGGLGGLFGGDAPPEGNKEQIRNAVIGKIMQCIEAIKTIPILYTAGIGLAEKMQMIDDKIPFPFVMNGRLNMQLVRYWMLRIESGDDTARPHVAPAFNQSVVAYRKSLKTVSMSMPKKADLPALAEFANLAHYGYVHRDLMRLNKEGLAKLIELGKEAADAAMTVDEAYSPLQKRLLRTLNQMQGVPSGEEE